LNNLGVLAARLHAFLPSINYYEQAMLASPQTRQVLDNVAEALNAVPVEYHNAPILAKTAATFQTQDLAMQQIEARDGLFRWGSSWVTAQQLRQLKTAEVEVNKQLDAIKRQNDALQDEIDHIDRDIAANSRQMNRMAASQTQIDQNGNSYQFPLPPLYYSMSDDNAKLQDEKKPLLAKQADLQENAKQVQHAMPKPPFSGIQHLMGPEALQTGFQTATQPSPSPGQ
jgi:DNA repair exonuclease SbcCD ATPase subunit